MRKWGVIVFAVVIMVALFLAAILQIIFAFLPKDQQESFVPYIIATGITGVLANGIVAIMQWFGVSPLDLLPERTLLETLRRQDRDRFNLSKSKNPESLAAQVRAAKDQKQYDWVYLFAKAWIVQRPTEGRAYEFLGEASIELNLLSDAFEAGNKLLELQPLNHTGYTILGDTCSKSGNYQEARIWHEKALTVVSPAFRQFVLFDLIKIYESLGLVKESISAIEEALPMLSDSFQLNYYNDKLNHLKGLQR